MNKRKKIIMGILWGLIGVAVVATVVAYLSYQPQKPMLALFIAGMGGVIVVNLAAILFIVNKNLRR